MRRIAAFVLLAAIALASGSCRKEPGGDVKIVVIGGEPHLTDPASGPLSTSDQVLLANVAQGLVRFDASGNIVSGLAERWTVTDDGLSYIFRLATANWADGRKVTADQVARLLKRQIGPRSKSSLRDSFGAVQDVVAMTDRVIEIQLVSPRSDLLSLLAQPQMALLRNGQGTGPFTASPASSGQIKLTRNVVSEDDRTSRERLQLQGVAAPAAVQAFAANSVDAVLGGTFADLPIAQRVKLPRNSLRFDPASGLFGLVPAHADGFLADVEARSLLSQSIDRDALVAAWGVPGLAARATLLEPGLDGLPAPVQPSWTAAPIDQRRPALAASAKRIFGGHKSGVLKIYLPSGPGAEILLNRLSADWAPLGLTVQRAASPAAADLLLIDEVAPSTSPAWFIRHFRCGIVALCDPEADALMDAARYSPVPAQRYALLGQAAARIDDDHLFIALAAPIRWSLLSPRIQNFAGNRYARHSLTDLQLRLSPGD